MSDKSSEPRESLIMVACLTCGCVALQSVMVGKNGIEIKPEYCPACKSNIRDNLPIDFTVLSN